MDKQKIAELAKQLETLVDSKGTEGISLNVDVYKNDGQSALTVNISTFYGNWMADGDVVCLDALDQTEKVDGVTFEYRYFQRIPSEFYFKTKLDGGDNLYHATKAQGGYRITLEDDTGGYAPGWHDVELVKGSIQQGLWRIVKDVE